MKVITKMKIGVLLRIENQESEEEMFCNSMIFYILYFNSKDKSTKNFDEFLALLGDTISLQGHKGYAGGLDVKSLNFTRHFSHFIR